MMLAGDRQQRWKAINIALYRVAFACFLIAGITWQGQIVMFVAPDLVPYMAVATVHQAIAWTIILYALLHSAAQFVQGGLRQPLKILIPRPACGAAAALYSLEWSAGSSLQVRQVDTVPTLDGIDAFFLFEWPDATRSHKHPPLVKTTEGWKVMQNEFGIQDEDDYYEDKFGVMLVHSSQLAGAGAPHLGDKPISNKPGPPVGGRGLHYTTDGSRVDVWHWKSVRSGSPAMNQINDNHFGPPLEPNPKKKRYTGGYTRDPRTGGGFKMNRESFEEDIVQLPRLPKYPAILVRFAGVGLAVDAGGFGHIARSRRAVVPHRSGHADLLPQTDTVDGRPLFSDHAVFHAEEIQHHDIEALVRSRMVAERTGLLAAKT